MSVEASQFKAALKLWASGVTVVTVQGADGPKGMTATSFTSVSLEPPQILVCINESTETGPVVLDQKVFAVNVLHGGQEQLSNEFAGAASQEQRFAATSWQAGALGAPILSEALVSLECKVAQILKAGTHWVVIGEVESAICREGDPLLYYNGGYRSLA